MKGLTEDQKDLVVELMLSDTWPAMLALVERFVRRHEEDVLSYDIEQGEAGLVRRKARLDGARSIYTAMVKSRDVLTRRK